MPAYTFSLIACSVNPSGARIGTASGVDVLLRHDATDAAEVVGVAVGVDHPGHRPVPAVLPVEPERRRRGLGRDQRVQDEDPAITLDERHVRQVEAAHLVDPGRHLEQALDRVERGLAPQARIDRLGGVAGQEPVGVVVPHHAAVGVHDPRFQSGDEAAPGVLEVLRVGERQRGQQLPVLRGNRVRGRLRSPSPARRWRRPRRGAGIAPAGVSVETGLGHALSAFGREDPCACGPPVGGGCGFRRPDDGPARGSDARPPGRRCITPCG